MIQNSLTPRSSTITVCGIDSQSQWFALIDGSALHEERLARSGMKVVAIDEGRMYMLFAQVVLVAATSHLSSHRKGNDLPITTSGRVLIGQLAWQGRGS
jgi:hypothetical protein